MENEVDPTYRWEGDYEKTWEALKEDESGSLQASIEEEINKAKRKRLATRKVNVRLGMMRHLYIVLDMSAAMNDQDLKPNRAIASLKMLEIFVEEYFDQNPIGQLGIVISSDKRAKSVTAMSGTSHKHLEAIRKMKDGIIKDNGKNLVGEPSLQNSLEMCERTLRQMPSHASRDVLIILGSLTTCDPGSMYDTIEGMKKQSIRCSVVGLSAEIHICSKLARDTGGVYGVVLDESHFLDLLRDHIPPPPSSSRVESSLIKMGFPQHIPSGQTEKISMCMSSKKFSIGGYYCPQCQAKYSELPVECVICNLTLVSAPHLARSYHHLFPLPEYNEQTYDNRNTEKFAPTCFSCLLSFNQNPSAATIHSCNRCKESFCIDCNLFIHESLHCCPGCVNYRRELDLTINSL
ncbi:general transcription factor IIH subunit 2-like [Styela clava]